MKKNKMQFGRSIFLAFLLILLLAFFLIPKLRSGTLYIVSMFATGDFTVLRDFVASYGAYAALISFLLMILQSVAAPLPAFLLTFANANLFGWWRGAILSWSSAMAGASLCFFIARLLGREAVVKLTSRSGLQNIEEFFKRHGRMSILIARLLPFISFDIVSYAAGLTSISFWSFFVATGIGQLPATIIYSYVGGFLTGGAKWLVTGLLILFALGFMIALGKQLYEERSKKKDQADGETVKAEETP
mgnify:CR=1 FL=1